MLVDKFVSKLLNWKTKTLSIGDRLTFIKAVMRSMTSYYMSFFKFPDTVLGEKNPMDCVEKDRGYQGYHKFGCRKFFFSLNRALILKSIWKYFEQSNNLWVHVINAIHGGGSSFFLIEWEGIVVFRFLYLGLLIIFQVMEWI